MPAMMLWKSVGIATSLRFMQILRCQRVLFVVTCCGRLVASFLGGLVIRHIQAAARRSPRQRLLMGGYISCLFALKDRSITLVYFSLSFSPVIRFLHPIIPSLITGYPCHLKSLANPNGNCAQHHWKPLNQWIFLYLFPVGSFFVVVSRLGFPGSFS